MELFDYLSSLAGVPPGLLLDLVSVKHMSHNTLNILQQSLFGAIMGLNGINIKLKMRHKEAISCGSDFQFTILPVIGKVGGLEKSLIFPEKLKIPDILSIASLVV